MGGGIFNFFYQESHISLVQRETIKSISVKSHRMTLMPKPVPSLFPGFTTFSQELPYALS